MLVIMSEHINVLVPLRDIYQDAIHNVMTMIIQMSNIHWREIAEESGFKFACEVGVWV